MARFGSGVVDVGVAISLQNNFSNTAKVVANDYRRLMGELSAHSQITNNTAGAIGSQLSQMLQGMYQAYDYSVGVQREIWMTSKIAGASAQQQSEMMQLAKDINEQTPLSAADVASAMRYLSMAGFKTDQINQMIGPASQLATILGTPVGGKGGVADMMTNIMTTFNIPMSQTASTVDDLYTAVTNANISLTDLADSIRYSGADAKNAGLNLRQLSAAIGVLGNAGIQGSMAGTAIGNMLRYLQLSASGARPKANDWLHKMGLDAKSFYDANGNMKNFDEILVTLAQHMQALPDIYKTQAWNQIFQVRGSRGISAMLDDIVSGQSKYFQIMNLYDQNQGIVNEVNEEFQKTPAGRLEAFKSSIENLIVTFGEAMSVMTPFINMLTELIDGIQWILQTGFGKFIANLTLIGTAAHLLRIGFLVIRNSLRMMGIRILPIKKNMAQASVSTTGWVNQTKILLAIFNQLNYTLQTIDFRLQGILTKMMTLNSGLRFAGFNPLTGGPMFRNANGTWAGVGPYKHYFGMPPFMPMGMGMPTGSPGATATMASSSYGRYANFSRSQVIKRARSIYKNGAYHGQVAVRPIMDAQGTIVDYRKFQANGISAGTAFRARSLGALTSSLNGLKTVGSGLLGLFGGPWGLGLTAAIGVLTWSLNNLSEGLERQQQYREMVDKNLTPNQSAWFSALVKAIKETYGNNTAQMRLDLSLNGYGMGSFLDGDTFNVDANSLGDPWMV